MIGVLIADDHPVVREGIKHILGDAEGVEVRAETDHGEQAIALASTPEIDVVLLDISMPGPGLIATIERIRQAPNPPPVLVLSMHPAEHFAVRAMRAGAAGYLTKDQSSQKLAWAIRTVHAGGHFLEGGFARDVFEGRGHGEETRSQWDRFSNREFQVLQLLALGKSAKEISAMLDVSGKTVSTYRARLLEKTGLKSSAELIRFAIANDIPG
jgi:DNA-binding NarL/FixJ family response regulator